MLVKGGPDISLKLHKYTLVVTAVNKYTTRRNLIEGLKRVHPSQEIFVGTQASTPIPRTFTGGVKQAPPSQWILVHGMKKHTRLKEF